MTKPKKQDRRTFKRARKPAPKRKPHECAACGARIRGKAQYSIHRDGFCVGPEVSLCVACGEDPLPTCEQLWEMIRERRRASAGRRTKKGAKRA